MFRRRLDTSFVVILSLSTSLMEESKRWVGHALQQAMTSTFPWPPVTGTEPACKSLLVADEAGGP